MNGSNTSGVPQADVTTKELADETKIALGYAKESSMRARSVIFLLMIISVLTFIAWWNHYEHAWPRTRLRHAQLGVHFLCVQNENAAKIHGQKSEVDKDCDAARTAHYFTKDIDLAIGKAFVERMRFNLPQARLHLQYLQQQYIAGVTKVTIPFLGLQTDVNDLGILSGLTFVILLYLFCFAVWREEQNVKEFFAIARRQRDLAVAYRLYSMTQVFTIPPHEERRRVNKTTTRFIYWMPALVLGLVAWYDIWMTLRYADEFTTSLDILTISVEGGAFLVIMLQRRLVARLADKVDSHWKDAYREILAEASCKTDFPVMNDTAKGAEAS